MNFFSFVSWSKVHSWVVLCCVPDGGQPSVSQRSSAGYQWITGLTDRHADVQTQTQHVFTLLQSMTIHSHISVCLSREGGRCEELMKNHQQTSQTWCCRSFLQGSLHQTQQTGLCFIRTLSVMLSRARTERSPRYPPFRIFRLQPENKNTLLQENTLERAVWLFSSPAELWKSKEKKTLETEREKERERVRLEMKSIFNVSRLSWRNSLRQY